jgi:stage V sporulation protein B
MGKSFVKSAGILAFSVIIAKVLGAVYRVPLANIVGANGMGLYQFVYPVFALLLTLSSGAVPTAVSITVSEYVARGDENGARRAFCASLKICLIIGLLGTAALVAAAYPISLLQSKDAFYGYLCIAPAVLIVTAISAFRGWFNGHGNLVPGSISQITEGIVKLGVGLALASYLMKYGVKFAVAGALLGVAASELVTLVVMFISYFACRGKFVAVKLKEEKDTVSRLKDLAAPLILCGMILPTSQFLDSVLIVNLLKLNGSADPTALYGLWSGIVDAACQSSGYGLSVARRGGNAADGSREEKSATPNTS